MFNLRYSNCKKKFNKIQVYIEELNKIIDRVSFYVYMEARSRNFKKIYDFNMGRIDNDSKKIIIDTKNILRKLENESVKNEDSEFKPKQMFYKNIKIQRFLQLNDLETSYYHSLITT